MKNAPNLSIVPVSGCSASAFISQLDLRDKHCWFSLRLAACSPYYPPEMHIFVEETQSVIQVLRSHLYQATMPMLFFKGSNQPSKQPTSILWTRATIL